MKKIASCLLALALLVTLTACSGKSDNLSDGTDTSGTVSDTVKDTEKGTETAPAETTGESNTTGAETGTEQPTSDSKATAPAKDTTSATNPPATNPPSTNPPATNPPTTPTTTVKTCNHSNTEVRNKKDATTSSEGYTGDTYCKDCGKLISSGSSIPKIKQTVSVSHDYYDAEMKAFNEINAERIKNGLSPLTWNEELYAGAKIRAYEHYEFIDLGIGAGPHKRNQYLNHNQNNNHNRDRLHPSERTDRFHLYLGEICLEVFVRYSHRRFASSEFPTDRVFSLPGRELFLRTSFNDP